MAKRAGQNGLDVVYLRREIEESSDLTPSLEALQSLGRQTLALGLSSQKAHVNRGKLCDHLCTLAETVCVQQVHREAWEKRREAEVGEERLHRMALLTKPMSLTQRCRSEGWAVAQIPSSLS